MTDSKILLNDDAVRQELVAQSISGPDITRGLNGRVSIRPHKIWTNLKSTGRLGPIWSQSYPLFLKEYLEVLGQTLAYFQRPKVPRSHHRIAKKDESLPYDPGNLQVVPFHTERAYHYETHRYWKKLKELNLLAPELCESYKTFVYVFGLKKPWHFLKRKKLNEPHSKSNSEWISKPRKKSI